MLPATRFSTPSFSLQSRWPEARRSQSRPPEGGHYRSRQPTLRMRESLSGAFALFGRGGFAVGDGGFCRRLLLLAHAIEAAAQGFHQVHDLRRLLDIGRDDFA